MQRFPTPDSDEHCEKRDRAESAQLALQNDNLKEHADWIIIIAFYQALHCIDAYLVSKENCQPKSHAKRLEAIRQSAYLRPIYSHFDFMYTASMDARYYSWQASGADVAQILQTDLKSVIDHVSPLI